MYFLIIFYKHFNNTRLYKNTWENFFVKVVVNEFNQLQIIKQKMELQKLLLHHVLTVDQKILVMIQNKEIFKYHFLFV